MAKSVQGIIYAIYRISVNFGTVVEASVVYTNSHFPTFLVDKQDLVIILRCTGLYPVFLLVFLQIVLHFLQFSFTHSL